MTLLFVLGYLLILAVHFFYALLCIRTGRVDLAMGAVRTPPAILSGLVALNGFSLLAFAYAVPGFILGNAVLHAVLTIDEVIRTARNRHRWVYLLNHVLWTGQLLAWRQAV